jgi:hypothetical protein
MIPIRIPIHGHNAQCFVIVLVSREISHYYLQPGPVQTSPFDWG